MTDSIAPIITAVGLVLGSGATLIVALRGGKVGNGEDKAISVTRINDTDQKVQTLIQQVDFLFDEITKLRNEKEELVKKVARLTDELKTEQTDHIETKRLLKNALEELADKNARILVLESAAKIGETK